MIAILIICVVLSLGLAIANGLATKTLAYFIKKKGYPLPTDEELDECSREVLKNIFR